MFGIDLAEILHVSAKTGTGVDALLQTIVERIPPPLGDVRGPFKALLFDSSWVAGLGSTNVHRPCAHSILAGMTVTAESYHWLRLNPVSYGEVSAWYNITTAAGSNSTLCSGDKIVSCHTQRKYEVTEVGIMHPEQVATGVLYTGQVGYIACNMKNPAEGTWYTELFS